MNASELNPTPDLAIPTLPVICERCRAEGMAGDEAFAGIPDILDFTPVPRRAHANNWTAEHQRAFVAGLALTGSARQAARALGRHAFGAEQLRKAKGGRSFDAACEAAMDVYRDRELARIHGNLKQLADEAGEAAAGAPAVAPEPNEEGMDPEVEAARERIFKRIERIQQNYLVEIRSDPEKRRAYEVLHGPVDWDNAETRPLGGERAEPDAEGERLSENDGPRVRKL
jgi:hypothetical protein